MTRQQIKNKINKLLRENTKGLYSDEAWIPVNNMWKILRDAGFDITITSAEYQNQNGLLSSKMWKFEVECGKKPIYGVLTAHGAGSVEYPLDKYDISAYVC